MHRHAQGVHLQELAAISNDILCRKEIALIAIIADLNN